MDINLVAPINTLSYGICGSNILDALIKRGHRVALFPINPHNMEADEGLHESIKIGLDNAKLPNFSAPCIRLYHQFDMSQWIGHGKHIGFPIFELDTFNEVEKHHLRNGCSELMVCSNWARNICCNNLDKDNTNIQRVSVVPLGVNSDIFSPARPYRRATTVFLNVGKWEVRKGHVELITAFNDAFNYEDDVELWMMCESPFLKKTSEDVGEETEQTWLDICKNSKLGNKIRFIPRVGTQSEVAAVMNQADCGVFPAKAEGWNLDLLEMMACGKLVIATNYSGHTQFCNQDNTMLVDKLGIEPAFAKPWFYGQGNWAKVNVQQVVDHMRTVHQLKKAGGNLVNEAGIKTAQMLSWDNTAKAIMESI